MRGGTCTTTNDSKDGSICSIFSFSAEQNTEVNLKMSWTFFNRKIFRILNENCSELKVRFFSTQSLSLRRCNTFLTCRRLLIYARRSWLMIFLILLKIHSVNRSTQRRAEEICKWRTENVNEWNQFCASTGIEISLFYFRYSAFSTHYKAISWGKSWQ